MFPLSISNTYSPFMISMFPCRGRIRWVVVVILLFTVLSPVFNGRQTPSTFARAASSMALTSWNPSVTCTPVLTTLEQIIGTNLNANGGGKLQGDPYATY